MLYELKSTISKRMKIHPGDDVFTREHHEQTNLADPTDVKKNIILKIHTFDEIDEDFAKAFLPDRNLGETDCLLKPSQENLFGNIRMGNHLKRYLKGIKPDEIYSYKFDFSNEFINGTGFNGIKDFVSTEFTVNGIKGNFVLQSGGLSQRPPGKHGPQFNIEVKFAFAVSGGTVVRENFVNGDHPTHGLYFNMHYTLKDSAVYPKVIKDMGNLRASIHNNIALLSSYIVEDVANRPYIFDLGTACLHERVYVRKGEKRFLRNMPGTWDSTYKNFISPPEKYYQVEGSVYKAFNCKVKKYKVKGP